MKILCWLGFHNWSVWRGKAWDSDVMDYGHYVRRCWRCRRREERELV